MVSPRMIGVAPLDCEENIKVGEKRDVCLWESSSVCAFTGICVCVCVCVCVCAQTHTHTHTHTHMRDCAAGTKVTSSSMATQ
jgi:hypothetical protein